ncbi:MAG: hypothetical protein ABI321_15190 [Polyangia bacterium]
MWSSSRAVLGLYGLSGVILAGALQMRIPSAAEPVRPLERALERGEVVAGVPRLDPGDPMANAAILHMVLESPAVLDCARPPRRFDVQLDGTTRHVRVPSPVVCQLAALKRISVLQPGFGKGGLGEMAAFLLARSAADGVELARIVVPPFSFTRDSVTFLDADLGSLAPDERLVGTYHTHPDDDRLEGTPSYTDLRFMRRAHIDFHGQLGWVSQPRGGLEWLFDVIDPRDGGWNVYSHDTARLDEVRRRCETTLHCPLDALRTPGSELSLRVAVYDEERADAGW